MPLGFRLSNVGRRHQAPDSDEEEENLDAPFVAVDPFRIRQGRWARRLTMDDIEQGAATIDTHSHTPSESRQADATSAPQPPFSASGSLAHPAPLYPGARPHRGRTGSRWHSAQDDAQVDEQGHHRQPTASASQELPSVLRLPDRPGPLSLASASSPSNSPTYAAYSGPSSSLFGSSEIPYLSPLCLTDSTTPVSPSAQPSIFVPLSTVSGFQVNSPSSEDSEEEAPLPRVQASPSRSSSARRAQPSGHGSSHETASPSAASQRAPSGPSSLHVLLALVFQTVPTKLYLCTLFGLPPLYFSRVARVFENADLCRRDIARMAAARATEWEAALSGSGKYGYELIEPAGGEMSVALLQFKRTWEQFVESLMHEWQVFNIISALLTSAVLTILQIDAAAADPLIRTAALLALVCTLMSLLYGCLYIVRFGTMRAMHKASEWALESQRTTTNVYWNVWVMLAMPAVWLSWSIVAFLVSIMAFVWRTGTADERMEPIETSEQVIPARALISAALGLGVVYFVLVVRTFMRYGDRIDRRWRERVNGQVCSEREERRRGGKASFHESEDEVEAE